MKKQIIIAAISFCNVAWAMDHKTDSAQQHDPLTMLARNTSRQPVEKQSETKKLIEELEKDQPSKPNVLAGTSKLFIIHPTIRPAKL